MVTEFGEVLVEVDEARAPVTSKHFLSLVESGHYQNAHFYRTVTPENQPSDPVKINVIQGGLGMESKFGLPIAHETTDLTGLDHYHGTVSMARDEPGSARTEFFICLGNQPELNFGGKRNSDLQGFAAFGQVVSGMDVIHRIHQQPNDSQMLVRKVRILEIQKEN